MQDIYDINAWEGRGDGLLTPNEAPDNDVVPADLCRAPGDRRAAVGRRCFRREAGAKAQEKLRVREELGSAESLVDLSKVMDVERMTADSPRRSVVLPPAESALGTELRRGSSQVGSGGAGKHRIAKRCQVAGAADYESGLPPFRGVADHRGQLLNDSANSVLQKSLKRQRRRAAGHHAQIRHLDRICGQPVEASLTVEHVVGWRHHTC